MCIRDSFKYMLGRLRAGGGGKIKVFGGGGGVIVPSEIEESHAYGVTRIYSPDGGATLGLEGMINELVAQSDIDLDGAVPQSADGVLKALAAGDRRQMSLIHI